MKEFPHKLSASGWDIGERRNYPTTGFSGTKDAKVILPSSVVQLDLPDQAHTNALVLNHLLRPENDLVLMRQEQQATSMSDAERLLSTVMSLEPSVRVIIDVGAQVLELGNLEMAQTWLELSPDDEKNKAVVFFDEHDHICVLDRRGTVEPLHTSPYSSEMDACLVFLDEVHTRGTDLKLPRDYRAAVTLGANLTKDRLVQGMQVVYPKILRVLIPPTACMRMRELGRGQSVVFCVPSDIQLKMRAHGPSEFTVEDILEWTICETWRDASRSIPIWAMQGKRHQTHEALWTAFKEDGALDMSQSQASEFLEDEAQSIHARYRPSIREAKLSHEQENTDDPIVQRCREFESLDHRPSALLEEQERELSPEVEREREVQRAPPVEPLRHNLHPDIRQFVLTGALPDDSPACMPALEVLSDTSAAAYLDITKCHSGLLVSVDFARTIKVERRGQSHRSDLFQRSPQWILTSSYHLSADFIQHMLVISPYEAQKLLPLVKGSNHVHLHVYAPRPNLGYRPLDSLDLYTIPGLTASEIPRPLIMELNLFAGQLYFDSFREYTQVCRFLGINQQGKTEDSPRSADTTDREDEMACQFEEDPVKFFKVHLTKVRRNCESIGKTHMGSVLDYRPLLVEDFRDS
jgi:hypothetical protein